MPITKEPEKLRRVASINIRAHQKQRDLIDRAAKILGKNRSDFMLDAASKEAKNILLDNRFFPLEEKDFNKFLKALDQKPKDNPLLRRTLNETPPWER